MLSFKAYEAIRSQIMEGELPPGAPLSEAELAASLSMSRTPIREALARLEHERLVRILPGRVVYASEISLTELVEAFEIRQLIEPAVAGVVAGRCDPDALDRLDARLKAPQSTLLSPSDLAEAIGMEVHSLIFHEFGNRRLEELIESLMTVIQRARRINHRSRFEESVIEHRRIIAALRSADSSEAAKAVEDHLVAARLRAVEILSVSEINGVNRAG
jgi:DNA-binding GntR family transcriptional regulator